MATPRQIAGRKAKAVATVRGKDALALRCEGLTFDEIGARLGFTRQRAHQLVKDALAAVAAERKDLAENQLAFELAQIDSVIRGMAAASAGGDAKAGMTILKAMERRAKLLGLDAPTKTDVTSGGEPLKVYLPDES
jgi:DNA-binding CsgD family transcriptional regulator